jgi:DNA-directed RNA polymerase subunit RPC12/RpoP
LVAALGNGPTYPSVVSLLLAFAGLFVLVGSYYYAKDQHIFVTDRRIIITKRFWGFWLFQVPIDSVVDASSSRALLGRLSSYGSLSLRIVGTPRNIWRDPKNAILTKTSGGVKVSVDGIRGPEDAVNVIIKTRMEFLEIQQMKEDKTNSKRITNDPQVSSLSPLSPTTNGSTLPVVQKTSATTHNKCPWCRREFDLGETVYYCPKCRTAFHMNCLESAFAREHDCPECGSTIVLA